jgi:hypothetical protein
MKANKGKYIKKDNDNNNRQYNDNYELKLDRNYNNLEYDVSNTVSNYKRLKSNNNNNNNNNNNIIIIDNTVSDNYDSKCINYNSNSNIINNNNSELSLFNSIESSILSIINSSIEEIIIQCHNQSNKNSDFNHNNIHIMHDETQSDIKNNSNNNNSELISTQLLKQLLPSKIINKLCTTALTSLSDILSSRSQFVNDNINCNVVDPNIVNNNNNNNNNDNNSNNNNINQIKSLRLFSNTMGPTSPVLTGELEMKIINTLLSSLLLIENDDNNNSNNYNNNNNNNNNKRKKKNDTTVTSSSTSSYINTVTVTLSNKICLDNIYLFQQDEQDEWSTSINNPEYYKEYKIPFFNRFNEYGDNHIYYEALLHGDSNNIFNIITTSTPRFNNKGEIAICQDLLPANIFIISFIDSFREINNQFLLDLESELNLISFPYAKEFVSGCFKNLAIQIHSGEPTRNVNTLMHKDLINSAIHLSLTLSGNRDVIFQPNIKKKNNLFTLNCKQQTLYLTSPTKICHGIRTNKISNNNNINPSIAIQFRTLLSTTIATKIGQPELRNKLCTIILKLLRKWDQTIMLPTYQQFNKTYSELINMANLNLTSKQNISRTIVYNNTGFNHTDN